MDLWRTEIAEPRAAGFLIYPRRIDDGNSGSGAAESPVLDAARDAKASVAVSLKGTITGWSSAAA